jgi:hypothetical protein
VNYECVGTFQYCCVSNNTMTPVKPYYRMLSLSQENSFITEMCFVFKCEHHCVWEQCALLAFTESPAVVGPRATAQWIAADTLLLTLSSFDMEMAANRRIQYVDAAACFRPRQRCLQ